MAVFTCNGNIWRAHRDSAVNMQPKLPAKNFTLKIDENEQFYLEEINAFSLPAKLYGDTVALTERIVKTFQDRPNCTGVLLSGEKGSGKTLLAKRVSNALAAEGVPTIVINTAFYGDRFSSFIQTIEQPAVILFDEFEKTYDEIKKQDALLTLLDGAYQTKKLFMVTCNDVHRLTWHIRNRPGRLYYSINFDTLDVDFIREYCADKLHNKTHIDKICKLTRLFSKFNFDMLQALVEEMNRFDEAPAAALRWLNARPEFDVGVGAEFEIEIEHAGIKYTKPGQLDPEKFVGWPLATSKVQIDFLVDTTEENHEWVTAIFAADDLLEISSTGNEFVFCNSAGTKLTLRRVVVKKNFNLLAV
jgi:hypothetical protein